MVHRHEQQHPNRPTKPTEGQSAVITPRWGTKHLLSQMDVINTGSPGEMTGETATSSSSPSCTESVLCEQWRPSLVLAAFISQPVQAGVKLIWKSSMRDRNMETHGGRGVSEPVGVHTGLIQELRSALAVFKVEQRLRIFRAAKCLHKKEHIKLKRHYTWT